MLTSAEERVCAAIDERREELVRLASTLIGFDTTAREPGDPPRQEAQLQEHLAGRLDRIGAEVDLWEPDSESLAGKPLVPPGLDFSGRPQLIARKLSGGGGRSLAFNGHIDVVSVEPRGRWASDPFSAEVRNGLLYGRRACDMKGGIAAMTLAVETLAELDVALAGDLVIATNTDGIVGSGRNGAGRAWPANRRRHRDRADGVRRLDSLSRERRSCERRVRPRRRARALRPGARRRGDALLRHRLNRSSAV